MVFVCVVETVTVVIPSHDVQNAVARSLDKISYPRDTCFGETHCTGTARFSKSNSGIEADKTLPTVKHNATLTKEARILNESL